MYARIDACIVKPEWIKVIHMLLLLLLFKNRLCNIVLTLKRIVFINRLTYMHSYQQYVKYLLQLRKCAGGYHRNMSDRNSGQLPLLAQRSVVEYKVFEVLENMRKSKDDQQNRIKVSMRLSAFLKWGKCPRKF